MVDYLKEAYKQALKARNLDEVPVGCVITYKGKIIARAYNKKECNNDPLGHCEIIAIRKACKRLKSWRLIDCDMYVTLEPCTMCLGAIVHSRIRTIYYGCVDSRFGSIEGAFNLLKVGKFNHVPNTYNLKSDECSRILKDYFKEKRNIKNKDV